MIGHSTDTLTKAKHTLTRHLSLHYHPLGDFSTTLNANYLLLACCGFGSCNRDLVIFAKTDLVILAKPLAIKIFTDT